MDHSIRPPARSPDSTTSAEVQPLCRLTFIDIDGDEHHAIIQLDVASSLREQLDFHFGPIDC